MSRQFTVKEYDHIKAGLKDVGRFKTVLEAFGFQPVSDVPGFLNEPDSVMGSGDAVFVLYHHDHPEAAPHFKLHGDTIFDLSFLVESSGDHPMVIEGVGKMKHTLVRERSFKPMPAPYGILRFDHNTLNVDRNQLDATVNDYLDKFGFEKGQFFDIKGQETGLISRVTRAPSKKVQIPFNEATDDKSQIQEYIDIHKGPGVQHIALASDNIIETMEKVYKHNAENVKFLDILDTYYEIVSKRVKIKESLDDLKRLRILVDQDEKQGYLLQIFTQCFFGGFFFELIQREGNEGFGEGNFQALFDSIELDQKRRGVI